MGLEEALDEPAFWILAGGGVAMEVLGFIISKRAMEFSLPIWQLGILVVGTIIAAAFFATKD